MALNIKAQIPADSLTGVYAGLNYEKTSQQSSWTISPDTITIQTIDSTNCQVGLLSTTCCWSAGSVSLYTSYPLFCNTSIANYYFYFHNTDSLTFIDDNVPQPPPATYTKSYRFYGKRIAPYVSGIKQFTGNNRQLAAYPNPASSVMQLSVNGNQLTELKVFDVLGNIAIKNEELKIQNGKATLDVSSLLDGVYFVQVKTNEGSSTQKFMVQH